MGKGRAGRAGQEEREKRVGRHRQMIAMSEEHTFDDAVVKIAEEEYKVMIWNAENALTLSVQLLSIERSFFDL